jgi:rhamnose utilization protein RhaD (predicted bifunctional aldolase and dehydrogenase)
LEHDSQEHDSHDRDGAGTRRGPHVHVLWYAATVLSLAANAYLLFMTHDLATEADSARDALSEQIAAVDRKASAIDREGQQRMDSISTEARQEAAAALEQARAENRKSSAKVASTLASRQAEQRRVASAVDDLKAATATAASKLNQAIGDVSGVKGDVNNVKADVTEKRDQTIHEPIQLYVTGAHQPYEIVVNAVKKNEVAGYLATPKTTVAKR